MRGTHKQITVIVDACLFGFSQVMSGSMVKAEKSAHQTVTQAALQNGRFYGAEGARLHATAVNRVGWRHNREAAG
jgi:hypothetical protein